MCASYFVCSKSNSEQRESEHVVCETQGSGEKLSESQCKMKPIHSADNNKISTFFNLKLRTESEILYVQFSSGVLVEDWRTTIRFSLHVDMLVQLPRCSGEIVYSQVPVKAATYNFVTK